MDLQLSDASAAACLDSRISRNRMRLSIAASGTTDPGVYGKQNQDAFFVWSDVPNDALVMGVFDGHGKETGRDAAVTAKRFFETQFAHFTLAKYEKLLKNPQKVFDDLFLACHEAIKKVFRAKYERKGYTVTEELPDGYLVRKYASHTTTCIRGGTTATVVVILQGGRHILVANVGDSSAVLSKSTGPLSTKELMQFDANLSSPRPEEVHTEQIRKASITDSHLVCTHNGTPEKNQMRLPLASQRATLMLTGDHSAECEGEFLRAREIRCSRTNESVPDLRFLFDSANSRQLRAPIFSVDTQGNLFRNRSGDYVKNVRNEWASVVASPPSARFSDALAFTRSLGDFHMHTYGVTWHPTVTEVSMQRLLERDFGLENKSPNNRRAMRKRSQSPLHSPSQRDETTQQQEQQQHDTHDGIDEHQGDRQDYLLVVASDGIWDNWKYEDLFDFLFSICPFHAGPELETANESSGTSPASTHVVQKAASELMKENLKRAKIVFGFDADNMTAIVCHFRVERNSVDDD